MNTNWSELFKIRLSNIVDESMDKHDVVKLLIVRKILRKYKKRVWIRIYTEHSLDGMKPDVYMENLKDKSVICWEIQKVLNEEYIKKTTTKYNNLDIPFMNSVDLFIVPLKECPDNISEINSWLDKYIA